MDFFDGFADLTGSFNTAVEGFSQLAGMGLVASSTLALKDEDPVKPLAKLLLAGAF